MDKSWTVVMFKNENSVEAVPTSWICENFCYWPSFSNEKLLTAIRKNEGPNSCWPMYEIKLFRNNTFSDYSVARAKTQRAEVTSDLNSDSDVGIKKRIIRKRYLSTSESESDDEMPLNELPSPPRLQKGSLKREMNVIVSNNYQATEIGNPGSSQNIPPVKDNRCDVMEMGSSKECKCCPVHRDKEVLLQEVLRKQNLNNQFLKQVSIDLQEIKVKIEIFSNENSTPESNRNSIFQNFNFPLVSDDELKRLEEYLSEEEKFILTVQEIYKLGGKHLYGLIQRLMNLFLTNEMASKYNWLGKKSKISFRKLTLSKVIIQSAQKAFPEENVFEIEYCIKKWLRRAKERQQKGKPEEEENNI